MMMLNTRDLKPYRNNDTSSRIKNDRTTTDLKGDESQRPLKAHNTRHRFHKIIDQVFQLPLAIKLIGPNIAVLAAVICFMYVRNERSESSRAALTTTTIVLAVGLAANYLLFFFNLRSIREIERTAQLIWSGNQRARVSEALLDNQTLHVGRTINLLLDSLATNRVRARSLVEQVVRTGDMERGRITVQLHKSTTHALASVTKQIDFASEYAKNPDVLHPLDIARDTIRTLSKEFDTLVQTTYPNDFEEQDLLTALQKMGNIMQTSYTTPINVVYSDDHNNVLRLPSSSASVLYRVSHEAVRNALQHAMSTQIKVTLNVFQAYATVQIVDDGLGFDIAQVVRDDRYLGLYTLREKVGLVDGEFEIISVPNEGTTVYARVPVKEA